MSEQQTTTPVLATPEVRAARKAVCDSCEFKNSVVPVCNECKCIIPAKVLLASQTCPKDKWAA